MIRHHIFDVDGLVIDSEFMRDDSTRGLVEQTYGREYLRDLLKPKMTGKNLVGCMQVVVDHYGPVGTQGQEVTAQSLAEARLERLKHLYAHEIPFIDGFLALDARLREEFPDVARSIATGCDPEFYALADARLNIGGLVDEGHVYQTKALKDAGLIQRGKPYPDIIQHIAGRRGMPSQESAVFEDAPNGMVMAVLAGSRLVMLTKTFPRAVLIDQAKSLLVEQGRQDLLTNVEPVERVGTSRQTQGVLFIDNYKEDSIARVVEYLHAA